MKKPLSDEARLQEAALWTRKKKAARDIPKACRK